MYIYRLLYEVMKIPEEIIVKIKADEPFFEWLGKIGEAAVDLGNELQRSSQDVGVLQSYKNLVLLLATCPMYTRFEERVEQILEVNQDA